MPGRDFTGPQGRGPFTGRTSIVWDDNQHYRNAGFYGMGRGAGRMHGLKRGFGFRHNAGYYHENYTDVQEKTILENEIRILKNHLSQLETRLSELSKND